MSSESPTIERLPVERTETPEIQREKWGSKWSFILCCIGYAVGLGNVWRFPKLAYENGGLAFLIPYWCSAMFFGLPGLYFEYLVGQYTQTCAPQAFRKMAPLFQGLGWTMCLLAIGISIYYNVLISWAVLYIYNVFRIPITGKYVWSMCNNTWNTRNCISARDNLACKTMSNDTSTFAWNGTCVRNETIFLSLANINNTNQSVAATAQYFQNFILNSSESIDDFGNFNWPVFAALVVVWILTCLAIMFGAKVMGYTAYITATVPYLIISIIFVRGITLDGAYEGIKYYILQPDFAKLSELKVWADAVSQCCYSLSIGIAGLMNMASYNDRHHNCFRDALIVVFADSFMSVFGGIGVFAILGFMAKTTGHKVAEVVSEGSALAFIAYPEATALMPLGGWVFALIFFFMLFLLGIGTQFGLVSVLSTAFADSFPNLCGGRAKLLFTPIVCLGGFMAGLIMCFGNGKYWLNALDSFTGSVGIPLCASLSFIIVCYVYGIRHFLADITCILGEPRNLCSRWIFGPRAPYFVICWMAISPIIGIIVFGYQSKLLVATMMENSINLPTWVSIIGGFIIIAQFAPTVGFGIWNTVDFLRQGKGCTQLFCVQPDHPSYARVKLKKNLFCLFRNKGTTLVKVDDCEEKLSKEDSSNSLSESRTSPRKSRSSRRNKY